MLKIILLVVLLFLFFNYREGNLNAIQEIDSKIKINDTQNDELQKAVFIRKQQKAYILTN